MLNALVKFVVAFIAMVSLAAAVACWIAVSLIFSALATSIQAFSPSPGDRPRLRCWLHFTADCIARICRLVSSISPFIIC